jgi:hypothetical protein
MAAGTTFPERAVASLSRRIGRRVFLTRSAVVGSALVAAPGNLLLRPGTAYAALCGCSGSTCNCSSLCCDGYTEFCCTLTGVNMCPTGTVPGGWWKVDGSSFCGGKARYYIDCHRGCGTCGCGGNGICSGSCSGTSCGCAQGSCANRKAGCTHFRYGNCNNQRACIGPILCRVVSCTVPWMIDATCSSTAVRTDNNTRSHNRTCAQSSPIRPVFGNWDASTAAGIGFYNNLNGVWTARQTASAGGNHLSFQFGKSRGDIPVVGDWNGNGTDGIGVYRRSEGGRWYLRETASAGSGTTIFDFGRGSADIPVVGDWNGDGTDGIGVYRRNEGGRWYLRETASAGDATRVFDFGKGATDIPVVGDWNGDGTDGIGVYRPATGMWYLRNTPTPGPASLVFEFGGEPGDVPVVGDWNGDGKDGIGVYRPSVGTWYLRNTATAGASHIVATYGPRWVLG